MTWWQWEQLGVYPAKQKNKFEIAPQLAEKSVNIYKSEIRTVENTTSSFFKVGSKYC